MEDDIIEHFIDNFTEFYTRYLYLKKYNPKAFNDKESIICFEKIKNNIIKLNDLTEQINFIVDSKNVSTGKIEIVNEVQKNNNCSESC